MPASSTYSKHARRRCDGSSTTAAIFAKPTKALFSELRGHFPINEQLFVFQVVDRNIQLALRDLDQVPAEELALIVERECKAHTRRGTPCQREPLPGRDYCPPTSTWRRTS